MKYACLSWFCMALALVGCGSSEISSAELLTDPESYVGDSLWIEGTPEHAVDCTLAGCAPGESPCNTCGGPFRYGEAGDAIYIRGDGTLPEPIWTREGRIESSPGPLPGDGVERVGCKGNEEAVSCAPSVPARIEALHGTLRPNEFTGVLELIVDDVRLDPEGPVTDVLPGDVTVMEEAAYDGTRPGL